MANTKKHPRVKNCAQNMIKETVDESVSNKVGSLNQDVNSLSKDVNELKTQLPEITTGLSNVNEALMSIKSDITNMKTRADMPSKSMLGVIAIAIAIIFVVAYIFDIVRFYNS